MSNYVRQRLYIGVDIMGFDVRISRMLGSLFKRKAFDKTVINWNSKAINKKESMFLFSRYEQL